MNALNSGATICLDRFARRWEELRSNPTIARIIERTQREGSWDIITMLRVHIAWHADQDDCCLRTLDWQIGWRDTKLAEHGEPPVFNVANCIRRHLPFWRDYRPYLIPYARRVWREQVTARRADG